jgi:hypothetical protein
MTDQHDALKLRLREDLDRTIDERIDRYLSVKHQHLIGNHHFAHASHECLLVYRDGHFTSCIMVTQAVSDGILKFVAERNGIQLKQDESKQDLAKRMQQGNVVSQTFVDACSRIYRSFRNDFHHMNPTVATINLPLLAKRNIEDLAMIERKLFACDAGPDGTLVPRQRKYWDVQP